MYYIAGFILLLGVLVFIHEFGHFIIAKAFKVRVETFSIGMGKKIFSFKRGETEYVISLFPLGGYVKLTGQDPREEVPAELESRSFRNKPLYARAAVVLAGPLFNAVLAILVFTGLYAVGIPSVAPVFERILPGSPAELAGFKRGDEVVSISKADGSKSSVYELADLERLVGDAPGEELAIEVKAHEATQSHVIKITPILGQDRDSTIGVLKTRGIIRGVERNAPGPAFVVTPGSFVESRHLPSPLWITELKYQLNGQLKTLKIENLFDFEAAWKEAVSAQGDAGDIQVTASQIKMETEDSKLKKEKSKTEESPLVDEKTYTLAWLNAKEKPQVALNAAGLFSSELVLTEIRKDSPAEKFGLQKGDILSTFDNQPIQSFASFRENLQVVAQTGRGLKLGWIRNGKYQETDIKPEIVTATDPLTEAKNKQFQIGAYFLALPAAPTLKTVKADNIFQAMGLGYDRSVRLTTSMVQSFYYLAKGEISPKTLGGPILILRISGDSLKQGAIPFLKMMAFISLNLFLLNLFPIPVLDGGHLLMYCIEAIRRKPLPIKFIEVWSTAGFVLLMTLMTFVMFNDIRRLIFKS